MKHTDGAASGECACFRVARAHMRVSRPKQKKTRAKLEIEAETIRGPLIKRVLTAFKTSFGSPRGAVTDQTASSTNASLGYISVEQAGTETLSNRLHNLWIAYIVFTVVGVVLIVVSIGRKRPRRFHAAVLCCLANPPLRLNRSAADVLCYACFGL